MSAQSRASHSLIALLLPLLVLAAACSSNQPRTNSPASSPVATIGDAATVADAGVTGPRNGGAGPTASAMVRGTVEIDFSGAPQQHDGTPKPFAVPPGTKALDAITAALGESSISTRDFGGSLGVFVTGFYGIQAEGNHFWEFTVNGKPSDAGVSSYEVSDGDVLGFKYSSY